MEKNISSKKVNKGRSDKNLEYQKVGGCLFGTGEFLNEGERELEKTQNLEKHVQREVLSREDITSMFIKNEASTL